MISSPPVCPPGMEKVVQILVFHSFLKNDSFFQKVLFNIKDSKVNSLQEMFLSIFFYLQAL